MSEERYDAWLSLIGSGTEGDPQCPDIDALPLRMDKSLYEIVLREEGSVENGHEGACRYLVFPKKGYCLLKQLAANVVDAWDTPDERERVKEAWTQISKIEFPPD